MIRQLIYSLKRQYPASIEVCRETASATNFNSGKKNQQKVSVLIQRAIALPMTMNLEFLIRSIPPNLSSNMGLGSISLDTRIFLIDTHDLPRGWPIELEGWIIYKNQRFDYNQISNYEDAYYILAKANVVDQLNRNIKINMIEYLRLGDTLES